MNICAPGDKLWMFYEQAIGINDKNMIDRIEKVFESTPSKIYNVDFSWKEDSVNFPKTKYILTRWRKQVASLRALG